MSRDFSVELFIMLRIPTAVAMAAVSVISVGCATHETSLKAASIALSGQAGRGISDASASIGVSSASWRDKWTATKLFEQAVAGGATVESRFNLATGYEQTGREAAAAEIYRDLKHDGQFTWLTTAPDNFSPLQRQHVFNVADESTRRLRWLPSAEPGSTGPVEVAYPGSIETSTFEAAVGVIGKPSVAAGAISVEQARELDAASAPDGK